MTDGIGNPGQDSSDGEGPGVLANLPRTRPQRASPRRAAAREAAARADAPAEGPSRGRSANRPSKPAAANGAAGGDGRRPAGRAKRAGRPSRRRARSTAPLEMVPSQGYESEEDAATGPVQPPGGADLLISAAEIVGELAKAGLTRSERLVKDALSRLPLS
jgi:hypothetical protein